jgi:hypothetical protein
MNTAVFDGIVREIGEVSTRRSFVRLLGGAAALSAGAALGGTSLARGKGHGAAKDRGEGRDRSGETVTAQRRGGKKITICYQNQTRLVKKSKLGNFPGYTRGVCPDGEPKPVVCTTYVLSGGPNLSDQITIDDDGSILNVTAGKFLLIDNNGQASSHSPVFNPGKAGDLLRVRATDYGGCRSFSPLWIHCLETGQSKKVFSGDSGNGSCANPKQVDYLDITFPIEL